MGDNLPPGVSVSDLPGNDAPHPEDLLPVVCEECGFTAETLEEMEEHEHDPDAFTRATPEPEPSRTWDDVKEDPTPTEAERYDLDMPPSRRDDDGATEVNRGP